MAAATTELTVAGQTFVVAGEASAVAAAICTQKEADNGFRGVVTVDGEFVAFQVSAVQLVQSSKAKAEKKAFGFAQALEVAS